MSNEQQAVSALSTLAGNGEDTQAQLQCVVKATVTTIGGVKIQGQTTVSPDYAVDSPMYKSLKKVCDDDNGEWTLELQANAALRKHELKNANKREMHAKAREAFADDLTLIEDQAERLQAKADRNAAFNAALAFTG